MLALPKFLCFNPVQLTDNTSTAYIIRAMKRISTVMEAASRTLVLCLAVLLAGFGCAPKLFEVCTDGLDNNGNGRIDCQDEGCSTHPYCRATVYNTYVGEHPSGREVQWAEGVQGEGSGSGLES